MDLCLVTLNLPESIGGSKGEDGTALHCFELRKFFEEGQS
jgi:hypothetical protein